MAERKKKKVNLPLVEVLAGSLLLHLVAGFILATIVIINRLPKEEAEFVPPPEVKRVQPKKLQYQVKMQKQQKKSEKPRQKRIQVKSPQNISIPNIDINLPAVNSSVAVGAGFGGGSGMGMGGSGGLGGGGQYVNLLGLRAKGEKIIVVFEASNLMLLDKRGGYKAFGLVKRELIDLLGRIPPGTLFNLITYGGGGNANADFEERQNFAVHAFKDRLIPITPRTIEEISNWLAPLHRTGYEWGDFDQRFYTFKNVYEPVKWDKAGWFAGVSAAMEMKADTIFVITASYAGIVPKFRTEAEEMRFLKTQQGWNEKDEKRWHRSVEKARKWAGDTQPGRVWESDWQVVKEWDPDEPLRPQNRYPPESIIEWGKNMSKEIFDNTRPPSVNIILFSGIDEPTQFYMEIKQKHILFQRGELLKDFASAFRGKFKEIIGMAGIKRNVKAAPPIEEEEAESSF